ncbi:dephospho-CoA kinase/protein folding accessory domain-containing protein [Labrenzia sp. THAF82]|uniref:GrpB family protein n=1 Tax=Labrenzia sp. THAF82 TaxID=2587861 RepID=UPI001268EE7B|nr:GrpB family protein [Labrenzia sp. THAF82]QFT33634.1 dephospho-CoA kinase/protein folding accessory domain-containing protein [Labrenzia sp. THAF82]
MPNEIEHVGSTSVDGLPAKPVLDIALLIVRPELLSFLENALCSIGYSYRGNKTDEGGHLFVFETSPDVRSIHLHAMIDGDPQWNAYLSFRDIMRVNAQLREQYSRLKNRLAAAHSNDRGSYTAAKASFIQEVLSMQESDRLKS